MRDSIMMLMFRSYDRQGRANVHYAVTWSLLTARLG